MKFGDKITGYCPTLNRPHLLARMLACWSRQTYANRELIVLDDAGQYENQKSVDGKWEIISVPRRFRSLGEKNNAVMAMASFDSVAVVKNDDDDAILPWAVEAQVEALTRGEIVQPRLAIDFVNGEWVQTETFNRAFPKRFAYHGCWAARRSFMEKMRGYDFTFAGDDQFLDRRRLQAGIESTDIDWNKYRPFYVYCANYHKAHPEALYGAPTSISQRGGSQEAYIETGRNVPYIGKLQPYEGEPVWLRPVPTKVIRRPW